MLASVISCRDLRLDGVSGRLNANPAEVQRARSEGRWEIIHAFPGVTNGPSNGICRKLRFSKVEELDITSWGGTLRCNHWVLNLST
jgi:hypothetical protein